MKRLSHGWLAAIIIVAVIIIDQSLKVWVKTHFYYGEELQIASWFRLLFIENNGMAFGMELGSKMLLTWFRIIAVVGFTYYLFKLRRRTDLPRGYIACIALITAGAAGNVLDCIFYGVIFNAPQFPEVAQLFPPEGGYGTLFNGRVVDMFYFPLFEWDWPTWLPLVGGEHFVFFQPIFNVADAALSVSVIVLIIFYAKHLSGPVQSENDNLAASDDTPSDGAAASSDAS